MRLIYMITTSNAAVLSSLNAISVTFAPFSPAAPSPAAGDHLSDGAVAGIIVGGLLVAGLGGFVLYSKNMKKGTSTRFRGSSTLAADLELKTESNSLINGSKQGPALYTQI